MRRVGSERGFIAVGLSFMMAFVLLFQLIDRQQDRQLAAQRAPIAPVQTHRAEPTKTRFQGAPVLVELPAEARAQVRRNVRHHRRRG